MKRNVLVLAIALSVLAGCSTTRKSSETVAPDPAVATAAAAAAAASEKLAAIPCRCDSVGLNSPWVKFLKLPDPVTYQPQFDILCKSEYPATVSINGQTLKQYKTGIFFTTVPFNEGVNRVTAEAVYPDGRKAVCEHVIIYEKRDLSRQPYPLWIESRSFEPEGDVELLPDDVVKVSFRASKGQEAWLDIRPGKKSLKCSREDFGDYSVYRAELPVRGFTAGAAHTLSVRLVPAAGAPVKAVYRPEFTKSVTVRNPEDYPLLRVKNDYSRLV